MMSLSHFLCILTIALCCLCSSVVAVENEKSLEDKDKDPGPKGPPLLGVLPPVSSTCPPNSVAEPSESQCSNDSLGVGDRSQEEEDLLKNQLVEVEEETVSAGLGGGLKAGQAVHHSDPEKSVPAIVLTNEKADLDVSLPKVNIENHHHEKEKNKDSENTLLVKGVAENERQNGNNRGNEAQPSTGQTNSDSLQGGRGINDNGSQVVSVNTGHDQGGGDNPKVEKKTEEKANAPVSEQAEETRKSEKDAQSDSSTVSSTVITDTQEHRSQQEQTPSSLESQSHNDTTENDNSTSTNSDTPNTPRNEESTTTTTTTTTLSPKLTNNKKGDADSSSSISNSVWVRVPLLIVVTLACILVC
ncbi:uncharacterized protein TM35_000681030 [Trypanosoma theileri]|uniref:Mucin-associated surface protein (MASP) n=1 Tax=Trypanosoma theileri TaxID=67003 RepID=A0A1X0NFV1_9TRYP|nr:uncharacterized protein TM35_000681030 [Trypanosoma theileri]ORC83471.1 hypothetical protein TM35_000681030 [Trypanosoma theileri]